MTARISGLGFAGILLSALIAAAPAAKAEQAAVDRIVAIGGDVTEILYALGLEDRIVAVDATSTFPPDALKTKSSVGYMRALAAEGVLSLAPTLILASEGAGPPESVRALKTSSVAYVEVPDIDTPEGVKKRIATIGEATGRPEAAAALISKVEAGFAALKTGRDAISEPLRVLFILNASGDRIIAGGRGTGAEAALALAGARNAADSIDGYKPITPEGLVAMQPDAIVLMSGGRGGDGAAEFSGRPAVRLTPAGIAGRILEMEGSYLLGFGPRAPDALAALMNWLYPDKPKAGKT